ncbi:MAG: Flp family type IVb pilin [Pseudonocardiales bacterium]
MLARTHIRFLTRGDGGASAVEYALLVAAIAAVIVAVLFLFGSTISGVFGTTCNSLKNASGGAPGC